MLVGVPLKTITGTVQKLQKVEYHTFIFCMSLVVLDIFKTNDITAGLLFYYWLKYVYKFEITSYCHKIVQRKENGLSLSV